MATHHGRLGGRLVEVVLALGLAVLSAGVLLAGLALVLWVLMTGYLALFRVSPILAYGIIAAGAGLSVKIANPVMGMCWKGLAAIWLPFLRHYGYEAHSLRPLSKNKATIPGDGREKNEG
jgi:hypothetical protein